MVASRGATDVRFEYASAHRPGTVTYVPPGRAAGPGPARATGPRPGRPEAGPPGDPASERDRRDGQTVWA